MTKDELIAALETATGPDRSLDRCIVISLGWVFDGDGWEEPDGTRYSGVDEYTASIDAALTLVPQGWEWIVFGAGGADVWHVGNDAVLHRIDETYAATPALALCIAALRARA